MDFNQISVVIGLLTLVSGAGVYLYSTVKKGRRDYLRADNADLTNSNNLLRDKIDKLEVSVNTLTETVSNLKDIANQTPAVTLLLQKTAEQHAEVIKQLSELTKEMSKLTREFSNVAQAIGKNSRAQDKNSKAQDENTKARE